MRAVNRPSRARLPSRFAALSRRLQPKAIATEAEYEQTIEMVDQVMAAGRLSSEQSVYMETLVQLVEAYESSVHAIDETAVSAKDALEFLLEEHAINASGLARLLGVHPSMGSKLLAGERALTVEHIRRLAARFKVSPAVFID